jgi:phospholipase/lecithinase/hemolysin
MSFMKARLIAPVVLLAAATTSLNADSFNAIYAFGDSLSDAGNDYIATAGAIPGPPYVDGHFTNGQVWVQDLSASLGLGALNPSLAGGNDFAYGGATSGTIANGVHTANASDLTGATGQISQFEALHSTANPNALYTIWIGANDLADILATHPSATAAAVEAGSVVANVDSAIASLASVGAKNFLIVDVPNLGLVPGTIAAGPAAQAAASALSAGFDTALVNSLSLAAGANISVLDTYGLLDAIEANGAAYGFTNVTSPCLTGAVDYSGGTVCSPTLAGQDQYLFWDELHPTAAGHELIADAALSVITPEPASFALIGVGLLGVYLQRRRSA